jgi:hypothetical protein
MCVTPLPPGGSCGHGDIQWVAVTASGLAVVIAVTVLIVLIRWAVRDR